MMFSYLFAEVIAERAKTSPEAPFSISKGGEVSYGVFDLECNRLANAMLDMGIEKGAKSAMYMPNSLEYLVAFYGASRAGTVIVPINFALKKDELAYILNKCDVEALFTSPPYTEIALAARESCPKVKYIIETSKEARQGVKSFPELLKEGSPEFFRKIPKKEDDMGVIMISSGTTGFPKGAIHTYKSFSSAAMAWVRFAGLTQNDCCYNFVPFYHITGLCQSNLSTALAGGRQVVAEKFSVSRFWDEVKEYGCTYFLALETIVRLLMQQPERADDAENSVRIILGGPPPDLWDAFEERFNCVIVQGYTSTEGPLLSITPLDRELRRKKVQNARGIYVGTSMDPAMKQAVWDEEGNEVGPGVVGELVRIGPGTMKEYYNDPEETEKAFKGGWLHMGDSGYRDEDGHFYFVDRIKDIVRRGGENISSREVENVLVQHPGVALAAVIQVPDPIRIEEVKAYIVPKPGEKVTAEDIWLFCEPKLADFKIPRYIEFRDEFPMTATHRVKKNILRAEKEDLIKGSHDREIWRKQHSKK